MTSAVLKIMPIALMLLIALASLVSHAAKPELLLLTKYQPSLSIDGWYMSEKLDGVRAYWNGEQLISRQGNAFSAPNWFVKNLPPFELDGELWISRGLFEDTLSIVSRGEPDSRWQRVSYHLFEVPNALGDFDARMELVRQYLRDNLLTHVTVIPQEVCHDVNHLNTRLETVVKAGGEGLVLRNPASGYETGRSLNALKVKKQDDMEGRVIGYRPGKGKYQGMTGALWVEIEGKQRFYIGTGLSDQDRKTPPAKGSLITFRHHGFTDKGIPRFASYLRVRNTP